MTRVKFRIYLQFLTLVIWKCNILTLSNIKYNKINSSAFQENQIKSITFFRGDSHLTFQRAVQRQHNHYTASTTASPAPIIALRVPPFCYDWILLTFTTRLEALNTWPFYLFIIFNCTCLLFTPGSSTLRDKPPPLHGYTIASNKHPPCIFHCRK